MLTGIVQSIADYTSSQVPHADVLEFRLDLFDTIDLVQLKKNLSLSQKPIIFTLRPMDQGGKFAGSESERQSMIQQLIDLRPHFFDVEWNTDETFVKHLAEKFPTVKLICSYHDLEGLNQNYAEILARMQKPHFHGYKIAIKARTSLDALRLALFVKKQSRKLNLTGIALGEKGQFIRALGPAYRNWMDYAPLTLVAATDPGQIPITDLMQIYHYKNLNTQTKLYGLIGGIVSKSFGHYVHNCVIRALSQNAVYTKMAVEAENLKDFVALAKELGFCGFSVTMPYKENIIPLLDSIDPTAKKIGAVNTVAIEQDKAFGCNTDGLGAIEAIRKVQPIEGKKVVILGAGGAAKAIAHVAAEKGASVTVLNRSLDRAQALAQEIGAQWGSLSDMERISREGYDILINCTPGLFPIAVEFVSPDAVVMDIKNLLPDHSLLSYGRKAIPGYEMYINQAVKQAELWFGLNELQVWDVERMIRQATADVLEK